MSWRIRHEGSPRSIEGLNLAQVVEGLQDGLWEPTDEIMGPDDAGWVAIENHPQLAEAVADLEQPAAPPLTDETRLDMNPLIDVALVLLVFFILTTSYAALQKMLTLPQVQNNDDKTKGPLVRTVEQVKEVTIRVEARTENDKPVIRVENEPVEERYLAAHLRELVNKTTKTQILIDAKGVDWGTVVAIQDAAKGAGANHTYLLMDKAPGKK